MNPTIIQAIMNEVVMQRDSAQGRAAQLAGRVAELEDQLRRKEEAEKEAKVEKSKATKKTD